GRCRFRACRGRGRRGYFCIEIPRPKNGVTVRYLSGIPNRASTRQRCRIGPRVQFLHDLLELLAPRFPLNVGEALELTVVDHELAGRLLERRTSSFGDSFDTNREQLFTRAACAELLIDAGAVVTPSVCKGLIDSRARG